MNKFYGIEFAYGSNVINNGLQADKVYYFQKAAERDAWVNAGSAYVGSGERAKLVPTMAQADSAELWQAIKEIGAYLEDEGKKMMGEITCSKS
jgi:DNA-binding transcriptional MocR family regulator